MGNLLAIEGRKQGGAAGPPGPPGPGGTRPARTLWVGLPLDGAVTEDGAAYAPYSDMQAALDWCEAYALANPGQSTFHIHASPGVLADFTVPPDLSFDLKSSVSGQGATVEKVTLVAGRSSTGAQVIFEGWQISGSASVEFAANPSPLPDDTTVFVLKDSAVVDGSILNPVGPALNAIFLSVGLMDPRALVVSIHLNGEIDLDETSFAVLYQTDFAQRLAAGALYITACKCSQQIDCYGTEVQLKDLERGGAFPYGAPTVTFLGAPGVVTCDAVSLVAFGEAGGKVVNGSIVAAGFFVTYPSDGGVAIAAGVPVKVVRGVASVVGTTEADMLALSGYTLTASSGAPDERVLVVGVSGQISGVFTGLTPGEAQYVAGGAIIAASALPAYVAGAASESWYRRIGVARTATLIENDFGEPEQVP